MASKAFDTSECKDGRHRARDRVSRTGDDIQRSVCRDCGCELVRTKAMRRWYRSGMLG